MGAHLVTGYAGNGHIKSEDQGSFNAAFIGSGQYVMNIGNKLKASIINNNTVRIADGDILMYGRHIRITQTDLTIKTGTAGKKRYDVICVTYNKNTVDGTETANIEVLEGNTVDTSTSASQSYPNIQSGNILNGATVNQMGLYTVLIDGVVLSKVEPCFQTINSLADELNVLLKNVNNEFNELKESLNILDTVEEIEANTRGSMTVGALAVKAIYQKVKDCFQSVSDGKKLLASAITDKRVTTSSDATFATMAANIKKIVLGSGNAVAADVLKGKTFTNSDGVQYTGTFDRDADRNNYYNSGKNDYNPTQATLGNDGALTVKNAAGTTRLTKSFSNSYNAGVSAADARVNTSSESYKSGDSAGYNRGYAVKDSNFNRMTPLFSGTINYERAFTTNADNYVEHKTKNHYYRGSDFRNLAKANFIIKITNMTYSSGSHWDNCYLATWGISSYNPTGMIENGTPIGGTLTIDAGFISSMYKYDGNATLTASVSYEIFKV